MQPWQKVLQKELQHHKLVLQTKDLQEALPVKKMQKELRPCRLLLRRKHFLDYKMAGHNPDETARILAITQLVEGIDSDGFGRFVSTRILQITSNQDPE